VSPTPHPLRFLTFHRAQVALEVTGASAVRGAIRGQFFSPFCLHWLGGPLIHLVPAWLRNCGGFFLGKAGKRWGGSFVLQTFPSASFFLRNPPPQFNSPPPFVCSLFSTSGRTAHSFLIPSFFSLFPFSFSLFPQQKIRPGFEFFPSCRVPPFPVQIALRAKYPPQLQRLIS